MRTALSGFFAAVDADAPMQAHEPIAEIEPRRPCSASAQVTDSRLGDTAVLSNLYLSPAGANNFRDQLSPIHLRGFRAVNDLIDKRQPFANRFNAGVDGLACSDLPQGCERNIGDPSKFMHLCMPETVEDFAEVGDWGDCCVHGPKPTASGRPGQPNSVQFVRYRIRMSDDSKKILWDNVKSLMIHKFGRENVNGFAAHVEIGVGSVLRIREGQTSVGLEILERIAEKFGLEPWQLLVPGLRIDTPPILSTGSGGTIPFRDLDPFESQLVTLFRDLRDVDLQHSVLVALNDMVKPSKPSAANPFANSTPPRDRSRFSELEAEHAQKTRIHGHKKAK